MPVAGLSRPVKIDHAPLMFVSVIWADNTLMCQGGLQDIGPPYVNVLDAKPTKVIVNFIDIRSERSCVRQPEQDHKEQGRTQMVQVEHPRASVLQPSLELGQR